VGASPQTPNPKTPSREAATAIQPMGSFTRLTYHIVFATKFRKRTITETVKERLYEYIGGILRGKKGHLIEIGGVEDHVHLLAGLSPACAVSDVIRDVKANSSKWLRDEQNLRDFEWQKGYGAFTVSYDRVDVIRKYIRNQKEHHRTKTFQEEYVDFLERHDVEFRLDYLFEDEHHG
jgi:REP element-mobilizing transposase RayT